MCADNYAERLSRLSPAQRLLLERRLRGEGPAAVRRLGIERRREAGPAPLSFTQQRLWFLDQFEGQSGVWNRPAAFTLTGPLDVTTLERSLQEITRRHEILRTVYPGGEGLPVQTVLPVEPLSLPLIDLRALPPAEQRVRVMRLAADHARQPFALSRGPILRLTLLRLGLEEHVLLLAAHHIAFDGWSATVFIRELAALYEAFATGRPSPLPELAIQYADYASWQQQRFRDGACARSLAYWREQLAGELPLLSLPCDRPRPAVQAFRGARQHLSFSPALTGALKELSRGQHSTLFMTLLAAFQTLLQRYGGQDDILVGVPVAGRIQVETEDLIGCFVNSLVLRTDLSGDPSFSDLLSRVHRVSLDAYAHQDLPFEKLVEALRPLRDPSRTPLFQVLFVLKNALAPTLRAADVTVSPLEVDGGTALMDLSLELWDGPDGLLGYLEYNTDLFDADTMARAAGHLETLLEGIVADPGQRLAALPLLTPAERRQLLVAWNDTALDYPRHRCIHHLVEEQAERTPDAIALVYEDECLTYRELNRRANCLAHYLRGLGVGPETLVGIYMERSPTLVVGLLGVLKAGGAYVPLDPAYPADRLRLMLEDCEARLVLTEEGLGEQWPVGSVRAVRLDGDWETIRRESQENPRNSITPESLAYVIYTSGSTGRPKGVMIDHRSVVNLCAAMSQRVPCSAADAIFASSSVSFDLSVVELLWTLTRGMKAVLLSDRAMGRLPRRPSVPPTVERGQASGRREEAQRLPDQVAGERYSLASQAVRHHVTLMQCTPSALEALALQPLTMQSLRSLRTLLVGGEPIPASLARRVMEALPALRIINVYGPTEATVWSAACDVATPDEAALIGRPLANIQVYILDRQLQPLPIGVPGELYIGGDGVARGYRNRPQLNAERFIRNPFRQEPGARLYRTGDLARYRSDGRIEFLGRIDGLVKVRGHRVELGEIEETLRQHGAVQNAVAVTREHDSGVNQLVAYVVARGEDAPRSEELLGFLESRLPYYMVPAALVVLDALPHTPSGKVDRRALPAPDFARGDSEAAFVAPRSPLEQALAQIWSAILGVERIGVHDNFFALGGHSLLATRIISRVRSTFGVELPLHSLFETPTLTGTAQAIIYELARKAPPEGLAEMLETLEQSSDVRDGTS